MSTDIDESATTGAIQGPVDLTVVIISDLEGANGAVERAAREALATGAVHLLDVVIATKNDEGELVVIDLDDTGVELEVLGLPAESAGLVGEDDLAEVAMGLPAGGAAVLIVWENTWARDFAVAVQADGVASVAAHVRIDDDDLTAADPATA